MNLSKLFMKIFVALFLCSISLGAKEVQMLSIWDVNTNSTPSTLPYVDKDAPKGGMLRLGAIGAYDNFNPFAKRGISAGYIGHTFETIGKQGSEDAMIANALIAKSFYIAQDYSYVIITLNDDARFQDGTKIRAEDIKYSFDMLTKEATPRYKSYYAQIKEAEIISPSKVKFVFTESNNKELPLIISQLPVISHKWGQARDLGEPQNTPPLGSGPYKLKEYKMGSYVVYERDKNWWGKDLAINVGLYNFDIIRIDYYRDQMVMREAFFAGEIDFYAETTIKDWMNSYNTPPVKEGKIVREEVETNSPVGMRGFFFNTRKPVFADKNVREALSLLFDFEWTNKALFYDKYTRYDSFFTNSAFAAPKYPTKEELEVLDNYRDRLSPEIFGAIPDISVTSENMREKLKEALRILQRSEWKLSGGKLLNQKGEQMKITILLNNKSFVRVVMPYKQNLEQLGIIVDVSMVDQTQYVNRIRSFDYDMIIGMVPQSSSPGNEQRFFWSSEAASLAGMRNYAGIRDSVVDDLIERLIVSRSYDELIVNTRALDRVLRHGNYVIPGWYSKYIFISWWKDRIRPPHSHPTSGINLSSWYSNKIN